MQLKNYEIVETSDGSKTLYSKSFGESCHSTSGAILETKLHYIQGCEIEEKSKTHKENLSILEVGFGTGIGFIETKKALSAFFTFVSLEIDKDLVIYAKNNIPELFLLEKKDHFYELKTHHFHLIILLGDARKTLPTLNLKFHAIYQDAFSPKKNASLWTAEWFKLLRDKSHPDVIMSTYSSSSSIRKSMIEAGFKLYKGEKFGPKRSSTRARLTGETDQEILNHLERSPAITLTDANKDTYK